MDLSLKITGIFSSQFIIDGKQHYSRLLKNHYKFVKTLQSTTVLIHKSRNKKRKVLGKIASKMKFVWNLQLGEDLAKSKKLCKTYHRIWSSTSALTEGLSLRVFNHLRELKLENSKFFGQSSNLKKKKGKPTKYPNIKDTKIEKFSISIEVGFHILCNALLMSKYPKTIKELSLSWKGKSVMPIEMDLSAFTKSSANLNKLVLAFPITQELLRPFLLTTNPRFLHSLTFFINEDSITEETDDDITTFLDNCASLQTLNLKFITWTNIFQKLNKSPSSFLSRLETLELYISVFKEEHLLMLGSFLQSLNSLHKLTITILNTSWEDPLQKGFDFFIQQLHNKQNLKILDLNYWYYGSTSTSKTTGLVSSLSKCILSLPKLEQLSFIHNEADYVNELDEVTNILNEKGANITKLALAFKGQKLNDQSLLKFIKQIGCMDKLEELNLTQLVFPNPKCFSVFSKTLMNLASLRKLVLTKMVTASSGDVIISVVEKLLLKPGMNCLIFDEAWSAENWFKLSNCKRIRMELILSVNKTLEFYSIPRYMREITRIGAIKKISEVKRDVLPNHS